MADEDRDSNLTRSTRALQHQAEQAGPAAGAGYTLIGAILLLGGMLLGIVVGMYELAKTVFLKK